jgi:DNA-binding XRE family transcriptional regulator
VSRLAFPLAYLRDRSGEEPVRRWMDDALLPDERRVVMAALRHLLAACGPAACGHPRDRYLPGRLCEFRIVQQDLAFTVFCRIRRSRLVVLLHGCERPATAVEADRCEELVRSRLSHLVRAEMEEARRARAVGGGGWWSSRETRRSCMGSTICRHSRSCMGSTFNESPTTHTTHASSSRPAAGPRRQHGGRSSPGAFLADYRRLEDEASRLGGDALGHLRLLEARYRLAARLQGRRRRRGLTQTRLAALTGVDRTVISRLESGSVNATIDALAGLALALDLELDLAPRWPH